MTYETSLAVDKGQVLLAVLRMLRQLRQVQPVSVTIENLKFERKVLERIVTWAAADTINESEVRALFDQLQEFFAASSIDPAAPFEVDDRIIRDVINGKTESLILSEKQGVVANYLALLANELPWERRRALAILDMITMENVREAGELADFIAKQQDIANPTRYLERWLPLGSGNSPDLRPEWLNQVPLATTSYLVRFRISRPRARHRFLSVGARC